jgi:membrane protein DedA with SNARE-associated domain
MVSLPFLLGCLLGHSVGFLLGWRLMHRFLATKQSQHPRLIVSARLGMQHRDVPVLKESADG